VIGRAAAGVHGDGQTGGVGGGVEVQPCQSLPRPLLLEAEPGGWAAWQHRVDSALFWEVGALGRSKVKEQYFRI